ncbi:MAG: DUF2155 domain-containing protein [Rhodospirillales bacterium]|nr:MAG: DUF2155 domain-containing protein [Rhodospirillales bacterium]
MTRAGSSRRRRPACRRLTGPGGLLAVLLSAVVAAGVVGLASLPAAADPYPIAVLRTLDKVTARVATLEVPVGEAVVFGSLDVLVRTCHRRPPEEPPESAAFLEVEEHLPGEPPALVFRGWMFASSPAVSAMDHPVYDIWVLDCTSTPASAADN